MSMLSKTLASLALTFSLVGCATTAPRAPQTPQAPIAKPAPVQHKLDRAAVRAKLAARRAVTLERFLAYREAKIYPVARGLGPGYHHVWIDENGNLCAAATLISRDWGRDAVVEIGMPNNGLQLAKVDTGPLLDWVLTSGLAHHEIVAIQVPGFEPEIENPQQRQAEIERLYGIYIDVERQLRAMNDKNLELAVDALMAHPELARTFVATR